MARQLVLNLGHAPSFDIDDFLASRSNERALALISDWPNWPDRTLLLVGPPGCGKTHLGMIWALRAGARRPAPGGDLVPKDAAGPLVTLVEDCDRAAYPEAALFHLINATRETGGWLLLTAREQPGAWGVQTPDLLSRLRLAPLLQIGQPDEILIRAVIVKLFADRQIEIEEDVVAYAARHCDRSLEAINRLVAAVDEASLEAARRVTRPLVVRTLAELTGRTPQGPT